ncbi:IS200/IS605 family transposase [Halanaerobium hydrogeniformans]|uniref:Transposase IS200-family protein n=1 Tax=Halanaerobium hydrogeniformans TaxID=656519 RepID=E4RLY5_HALHG|nr:IS200/IS605 family transposase [Halanaerobium hydrogeniformans]ADQ14068.1 transposase IS200-family protein [Halanaerobium hydrogeniformans]
MSNQLDSNRHAKYNLIYHLVVVTKFRKECISDNMYSDLNKHFKRLLEGKNCNLLEFGGEKDHIHVMFSTPPQVQLSKVLNSLKTSTSRLIRRDYGDYLKDFYLKNISGQEVIVLCVFVK